MLIVVFGVLSLPILMNRKRGQGDASIQVAVAVTVTVIFDVPGQGLEFLRKFHTTGPFLREGPVQSV